MAERQPDPREADEWRVEVKLEADELGHSLGERLRALDLDNEARKRLGGSIIVTRDGPNLFLYSWHEEGAQEAERVIRELMESDGLAGEVVVTRWHPVEEEWRAAGEPQPDSAGELSEEQRRHERAAEIERAEAGQYPWEVVIDLPDLRSTRELGQQLAARGLPVRRRFKYLLVGTDTEDAAVELGRSFEGRIPEGSHVGIRANPEEMPVPAFVQLGSLKPGVMRDLGL